MKCIIAKFAFYPQTDQCKTRQANGKPGYVEKGISAILHQVANSGRKEAPDHKNKVMTVTYSRITNTMPSNKTRKYTPISVSPNEFCSYTNEGDRNWMIG